MTQKIQTKSLHTFFGETLEYEKGDAVLKHLQEGWFEAYEMIAVYRYLRDGDTVLDIGAHAGLYSVLARRAVGRLGRVFAFEPNARTRQLLSRNLGVEPLTLDDPLTRKRRVVLPYAASDRAGQARLSQEVSGMSAYGALTESDGVQVRTVTVDAVSEAAAIRSPAFIKIDVEGHEAAVIRGARATMEASRNLLVLVEFNEGNLKRAGSSAEDLRTVIEETGYRLHEIDPSSGLMTPAVLKGPVYYKNFFAMRDADAVNARIKSAGREVEKKVEQFLPRAKAAVRLHEQSEGWRNAFDRAQEFGLRLASLHDKLVGEPDRHAEAFSRRFDEIQGGTDYQNMLAQALSLLADEFGAIEGVSQYYRGEIGKRHQELVKAEAELAAAIEEIEALESASLPPEAAERVRRARVAAGEAANARLRSGAGRQKELPLEESDLERIREAMAGLRVEAVEKHRLAVELEMLKVETDRLRVELEEERRRWSMRNERESARDEAYRTLLDELGMKEDALRQAEALSREHSKTEAKLQKLQARAEAAEAGRAELERTFEAQVADLISERDASLRRIEELRGQLRQSAATVEALKDELEIVRQAHDEQFVRLRARAETAEARRAEVERAFEAQVADLISERDASLRESEELRQELRQSAATVEALHEKLDIFRQARDEQFAELKAQTEASLAEKAAKLEDARARLQIVHGQKRALESRLMSQSVLEKNIAEARQRVVELEANWGRATVDLRAAHERAFELETANSYLEDEASHARQEAHRTRLALDEAAERETKLSGEVERLAGEWTRSVADAETGKRNLRKGAAHVASLHVRLAQNAEILRAARSSRWLRLGGLAGSKLDLALENLIHEQERLRAEIALISNSLGEASGGLADMPDAEHRAGMAAGEAILLLGDGLIRLRRSRWVRLAGLLGLPTCRVIDEAIEVFEGRGWNATVDGAGMPHLAQVDMNMLGAAIAAVNGSSWMRLGRLVRLRSAYLAARLNADFANAQERMDIARQ